MIFRTVWSTIWGCEPTIAAAHVELVVWTSVDHLLTEELDRASPYRKVVVVRKGRQVVVRVVCLLSGGGTSTTVEFLAPRTVSARREEIVNELVMRTRQRETEHKLARRLIGFAPNERREVNAIAGLEAQRSSPQACSTTNRPTSKNAPQGG